MWKCNGIIILNKHYLILKIQEIKIFKFQLIILLYYLLIKELN